MRIRDGLLFALELSAATLLPMLIYGMYWIGARKDRKGKQSMSNPVPVTPVTSLDMALIEIERALQAHLYYLALISTLSLIDMCAALEDEDGETNQTKFRAWYSKNLAEHYTWLSDQDCYGLRCGILHRGVMDHAVRKKPKSTWNRIAFSLPDANGNTVRQMAMEDFYCTGLAEFCQDVTARVRAWADNAKHNPIVRKNAENLMRYHPNGIAPYFVGMQIFG